MVAQSADAAELHAPVPTLLLELQTLLGTLAATVAARPSAAAARSVPAPTGPTRLGELAYGVYLLADQTGVDIQAVAATAQRHGHGRDALAGHNRRRRPTPAPTEFDGDAAAVQKQIKRA